MDAQAIYRKSAKGTEAITTRGASVSGKLRMLLILVDGKKTVEELVGLAAGMGESAELVKQLDAQGLIELVSAGAAKQPSVSNADLGKVKALATRLLVEQLGPMADELSLQLEESKGIPQFVEVMKRAYTAVRNLKGQAAADRFGAAVEAQMPAA